MARRSIDSKEFDQMMSDVRDFITDELPDLALDKFKSETPVQSGNARRKTRLRKTRTGSEIQARYPYANVLDSGLYPDPPKRGTGKTRNGYSTQAPRGMSEPTVDFIEDAVEDYLRKL